MTYDCGSIPTNAETPEGGFVKHPNFCDDCKFKWCDSIDEPCIRCDGRDMYEPTIYKVRETVGQLPGAKWDNGKPILSLVPPDIVKAICAVRMYGKAKYQQAEDWTKVDRSRWHEALLRHVLAMWNDPDSIDEESGLPHSYHAACNLDFLIATEEQTK